MLQILPSDRFTIAELCEHPWVVSSGALPPEYAPVDQVSLLCGECEEDNGEASKPIVAKWAEGVWCCVPLGVRSKLAPMVYVLLVVGALLYAQSVRDPQARHHMYADSGHMM